MAADEKLKVGIIGCGNISKAYLETASEFDNIQYSACADLNVKSAETRAREFGIAACSVAEMLQDPEIAIIANLTPPNAHYPVSKQILDAGKHAYYEKPMADNAAQARMLMVLAARKGLRLGGAPDTFLGASLQTYRKLIDEDVIGEPVEVIGSFVCGGHESWHPEPDFYYQEGGGPLLDMGPYYITAMVNLLGRVSCLTATSKKTFEQREITSERHRGKLIDVEVDTHVKAFLDFESGASGTLITSFDIKGGSHLPRLEVYGTKGSIAGADPNNFGDPVMVRKAGGEWREVPLTHRYTGNNRGLGIDDMADAIKNDRQHRANEKQTFHALEVMKGIHAAAKSRKEYVVQSFYSQPEPLQPIKL